jgi:hypothetical protein
MKFLRRRAQDKSRDEEREREDFMPMLFAPRAPAPNAEAPPPVRGPVMAPAGRVGYFAPNAPSDANGMVQLLPGRLEPLNEGMHQEIRFLKTPGVKRFTFGRSPGPEHSHIQLRAATASRMHAYMVFDSGEWRIGNLSQTNSVIVNGLRLGLAGTERVLADGDRIELGEISFVFRAR